MIPGYPHPLRFHNGSRSSYADKSPGHKGESMGEDEVVPLREDVSHHLTLKDSTFPGYPYGLRNADRIAMVRPPGFEHVHFLFSRFASHTHLGVDY